MRNLLRKKGPPKSVLVFDLPKFEARYAVAPSGCWEWTGHRNEHGYGVFYTGQKQQLAHRIAYQWFVGDIGPETLVCHHCDNPCCVNPWHLYAGSQTDNMRDMEARGRTVRPTRRPAAKITAEIAADIRRRYVRGVVTLKMLGDEYGLAESGVHRIVHGQTWA